MPMSLQLARRTKCAAPGAVLVGEEEAAIHLVAGHCTCRRRSHVDVVLQEGTVGSSATLSTAGNAFHFNGAKVRLRVMLHLASIRSGGDGAHHSSTGTTVLITPCSHPTTIHRYRHRSRYRHRYCSFITSNNSARPEHTKRTQGNATQGNATQHTQGKQHQRYNTNNTRSFQECYDPELDIPPFRH